MKSENEIAEIIFEKLKGLEINHTLNWFQVKIEIQEELDGEDKSVFERVVKDLETQGYIKIENAENSNLPLIKLFKYGGDYEYGKDSNSSSDSK